jgi:predicted anti-sigma-YlaC factor YlaD
MQADSVARPPGGLSCREMVELVTDYLEGTLARPLDERFEAHLAACPGCGEYLEQMRRTLLLVGSLREESVPAAAWDPLLHAFRTWRDETREHVPQTDPRDRAATHDP